MVQIPHTLKFVTEVDETHPIGQRLLGLPLEEQIEMLERMLKALIIPTIQPEIDRINEGGSYAILKVAE
jgi:hypothetical protein